VGKAVRAALAGSGAFDFLGWCGVDIWCGYVMWSVACGLLLCGGLVRFIDGNLVWNLSLFGVICCWIPSFLRVGREDWMQSGGLLYIHAWPLIFLSPLCDGLLLKAIHPPLFEEYFLEGRQKEKRNGLCSCSPFLADPKFWIGKDKKRIRKQERERKKRKKGEKEKRNLWLSAFLFPIPSLSDRLW
jgi:hypothetical protein